MMTTCVSCCPGSDAQGRHLRHARRCRYARAADIEQNGMTTRFRVHIKAQEPFDVTLNMPGRHNVLNALAAIAVT